MQLEILEKSYFYHIYNRGINSENIYLSDENKSYFLKQFSKYLIGKVEVYAYCLMDNHFHFVIRIIEEVKNVTQSFSNFFNSYLKSFNKQSNRTGSLFEKHFKRIKIEDENYLRNVIQYVHLNPKLHLNLDYKTFKFSSYQAIISTFKTYIPRNEVIELFGDVENFIYCNEYKNEILPDKYTLE